MKPTRADTTHFTIYYIRPFVGHFAISLQYLHRPKNSGSFQKHSTARNGVWGGVRVPKDIPSYGERVKEPHSSETRWLPKPKLIFFVFFLALNTHIHIHPASGLITEIVCTTLLIFSKNGSSPPIDANAKPSWIGKVGVLRLQARSPTKVCGS